MRTEAGAFFAITLSSWSLGARENDMEDCLRSFRTYLKNESLLPLREKDRMRGIQVFLLFMGMIE